MQDIKGHVVLLMAPSGSGKKTVIDGLGELMDQMYFAKTFTSRARREGTTESPKYIFISEDEFKELIEADEFVEWANYSGNFYGTKKDDILGALQEPQIVFKEMELQGVEQMRALIPKERLTVIYIDAGSWDHLKKRILDRAPISDEELELRHKRYEEEIKFKDSADIIVSNLDGQVAQAQAEFKAVIENIINSIQS